MTSEIERWSWEGPFSEREYQILAGDRIVAVVYEWPDVKRILHLSGEPMGTIAEPMGTLTDAADRVAEWVDRLDGLAGMSLQADDLRRLVDHAHSAGNDVELADRLTGDIMDAVPDDNDMQHVLEMAAYAIRRRVLEEQGQILLQHPNGTWKTNDEIRAEAAEIRERGGDNV